MIERADGEPLSIGRQRRTIPPAIRRALQSRAAGCRFPGCSHHHFLHGHHLRHWADGGDTSLTNLVQLCSFHHRLVHEGGFNVQRAADGDLHFHTPLGQRIAPAPVTPDASAEDVAIDNARFDLDITARTGDSQWDGGRVDYDHVLFTFFASKPIARARPAEPA